MEHTTTSGGYSIARTACAARGEGVVATAGGGALVQTRLGFAWDQNQRS